MGAQSLRPRLGNRHRRQISVWIALLRTAGYCAKVTVTPWGANVN
jgi:hypothetical protein